MAEPLVSTEAERAQEAPDARGSLASSLSAPFPVGLATYTLWQVPDWAPRVWNASWRAGDPKQRDLISSEAGAPSLMPQAPTRLRGARRLEGPRGVAVALGWGSSSSSQATVLLPGCSPKLGASPRESPGPWTHRGSCPGLRPSMGPGASRDLGEGSSSHTPSSGLVEVPAWRSSSLLSPICSWQHFSAPPRGAPGQGLLQGG